MGGREERATYTLLSERIGRSGRSNRGAEVVRAWPRGLASGAPPLPLPPPLIVLGGAYDRQPWGSPASTGSHTQHHSNDEPPVEDGEGRAPFSQQGERAGQCSGPV